jgi:hypothetical protein
LPEKNYRSSGRVRSYGRLAQGRGDAHDTIGMIVTRCAHSGQARSIGPGFSFQRGGLRE